MNLTELNASQLFQAYFLFFCGAAVLSVLLNIIFLRFSKTLGIRNHDLTIARWSADSKPALGGISFFMAFLLAFFVFVTFFNFPSVQLTWQQIGFVAAAGIAFLMGLSDDAYNTKPLLKFGVQLGCGVLLVATGTYITLFSFEPLNYALTVFWVIAVMNSINMLDNMDGITTVVSLFITLIALGIVFTSDQFSSFYATILVGVTAALLSFLFFNWNPSKMFMGDAGSQFLGIFLAAIGIQYFWNFNDLSPSVDPLQQIVVCALAFALPIADTTTVVINRIRRGQSPFVGGKDHTTHHLSYLGCSDKQVGLIFTGISTISFLLVFIITNFIEDWKIGHSVLFFVYFLLVIIGLFSTTKLKKAREKFNELEAKRARPEET